MDILIGLAIFAVIAGIYFGRKEMQKQMLLVDWEYEPRFHRAGRVILFLQGALSMTDRQVDDFFVLADSQEGQP